MIDLEPTSVGVILPIQAQPKARRNGINGVHAGRLKIAVTAAPEKGKANQAILKVLARVLQIKRSQLSIIAGEVSSHKKCLVRGVAIDDLRRRILECVSLSDSW